MWFMQHPLSSDRPVLTDFSASKPEQAASAYVTTSIRMADGRVAVRRTASGLLTRGVARPGCRFLAVGHRGVRMLLAAQSIISASDKSHPGTSTASFGPFGAASLRSYRVHGRAGSNSSGEMVRGRDEQVQIRQETDRKVGGCVQIV